MAITIDWTTKIISVDQVTPGVVSFVGGNVYQLDTDAFRLALKDLEDNADGIVFLATHRHNTTVLLGGIQYSRIIEIINGYTVTFEETGSPYVVNLSGSNNNILDVTNLGTVQIRSNNSAGLINVNELQHGIFDDVITVDAVGGTPGTTYPSGTPLQPVDNVTDAAIISAVRGITKYRFIGNYTFASGDNLDGISCYGEGPSLSILDLGANTSTHRTQFYNCELTGDVNGAINVIGCHIESVTGVGSTFYETGFHNCLLEPGTVFTLDNTVGTKDIYIIDCNSGSPGDVPVSIDFNGAFMGVVLRKYDGGVKYLNITQGNEISMGGDGHVHVDPTCTSGTLVLRGDLKYTDNSTGSFTVTDQATFRRLQEIHERLDLDSTKPNVYNSSSNVITGTNFTLTPVVVGNDTTVTRS